MKNSMRLMLAVVLLLGVSSFSSAEVTQHVIVSGFNSIRSQASGSNTISVSQFVPSPLVHLRGITISLTHQGGGLFSFDNDDAENIATLTPTVTRSWGVAGVGVTTTGSQTTNGAEHTMACLL